MVGQGAVEETAISGAVCRRALLSARRGRRFGQLPGEPSVLAGEGFDAEGEGDSGWRGTSAQSVATSLENAVPADAVAGPLGAVALGLAGARAACDAPWLKRDGGGRRSASCPGIVDQPPEGAHARYAQTLPRTEASNERPSCSLPVRVLSSQAPDLRDQLGSACAAGAGAAAAPSTASARAAVTALGTKLHPPGKERPARYREGVLRGRPAMAFPEKRSILRRSSASCRTWPNTGHEPPPRESPLPRHLFEQSALCALRPEVQNVSGLSQRLVRTPPIVKSEVPGERDVDLLGSPRRHADRSPRT